MSNKMSRFTVYLRALGRVTIPDEIRQAWGLNEGDLVELEIKSVEPVKEAVD